MSEYTEKRVVVQAVPVGRGPVVESRVDSVVNEKRGMSGVAVAALVVASITAAAVITMLIVNSQQKPSDDQLAQDRARTAAAQQAIAQPAPQQPLIVTLPASQPAMATVPSPMVSPVQPPPSYTDSAPSNAALEIDVTSLLQNDAELLTYAIDVKVADGTAMLSGNVSEEALKKRAGKLAGTVHGIKRVINNIEVKP
jgi:BON domain